MGTSTRARTWPAASAEKLGEGDTEGRSLPGAGSGSGDKVRTFFEKARYGEDLYRRGLLESLSRKGGKSRGPESERLERWDIHKCSCKEKDNSL